MAQLHEANRRAVCTDDHKRVVEAVQNPYPSFGYSSPKPRAPRFDNFDHKNEVEEKFTTSNIKFYSVER